MVEHVLAKDETGVRFSLPAFMNIFEDLKNRGLVYQVSNEEKVKEYLSNKGASFYCGFDPSGESLQVGNLLVIITAKRLERAGLKPIVLVGGATGLVGDPSGKMTERELKSEKEVEQNGELLKKQLGNFFDFNAEAIFVNNYEWFKNYSFLHFIRDIGKKFTISEMIAKDAVKNRLETGISFAEFSYSLIQATDFLKINEKYNCELQIGGSDQWGNITAGIELVRKTSQKEVCGFTWPLVTDASGKKIGKSEGNAVWLDAKMTSPYHFYQFWVNASDTEVIKFLKYYTFLSLEEIKSLENSIAVAPEKREAQKALAKEVTTFTHNESAFKNAEKISDNLFGGKIKDLSESDLKQIFTDSSVVKLENFSSEGMNVIDLIVDSKIVDSKRQAREDVQNNAIELNGEKINDINYLVVKKDLLFGNYLVAKRGKRDYRFVLVG